jgi:cobalt/nickel transport system permease protein
VSGKLFRPGNSPIHQLPAQCKVAATFLFVLAVVATPREAFWAYAVYTVSVVAVARIAGVPLSFVARRLVIELPFLAFAFFLPIIGGGERVDVLGVSLSVDGLWAAWNILVKGTLGVTASVVLAATTDVSDLLHGLERLHIPRQITAIAGFMIRYGVVITDEMHRMRVARESRGYDPRWLWQARAIAASAATLFIRSFERGERVHLAMVSRGYTGTFPVLEEADANSAQWKVALALPAATAVVAVTAWMLQ